MCKQCVEAVDKYFPDVDDDGKEYILWNETAFPHGGAEYVANQVKEYAESLGDDPSGAVNAMMAESRYQDIQCADCGHVRCIHKENGCIFRPCGCVTFVEPTNQTQSAVADLVQTAFTENGGEGSTDVTIL